MIQNSHVGALNTILAQVSNESLINSSLILLIPNLI